MSARPTRLTADMAERAARVIAEELARDGHIKPHQIDAATAEIASHGRPHIGGYELAKKLDDYEYWDCDLQMAEVLDGFSGAADKEIKAAQKQWAEANDIQPPFPVGTRVIASWGREDHIGTIDEVSKYGVAQYCVMADGETGSSRMIVNFEDVRALETEAVPAMTLSASHAAFSDPNRGESEMNSETLEALKGSIAKWERNAVAETPNAYKTGLGDCPLCKLFFKSHDCGGCPVAKKTKADCCDGSPYEAAWIAWGAWYRRPDSQNLKKRAHSKAKAEVAFLKSILPSAEMESGE